MPTFSLIIPTMGRTEELNELFESLARQNYDGFDCIVVDQNPDERLLEILDRWSQKIAIRRLRVEPGASRARNLGLRYATGDIVAFPDDDCWYSPGLLRSVATWFEENRRFSILAVGAKDSDGSPSGNRWVQKRCVIRPINAFRTTFCSSIFIRRSAACRSEGFDERVGPGSGTRWACGEETDFVLDLCDQGAIGFYDRRWYIGHPKRDMLSGEIDSRRAIGYGRGMGYVLNKHSLFGLGVFFVLYDLLRVLIVAVRGDVKGMSLCFYHACGLISGCWYRPEDV